MEKKPLNAFVKRVTSDEPGLKVKKTRDSLCVLLERAVSGWFILLGKPERVKPIEDAIIKGTILCPTRIPPGSDTYPKSLSVRPITSSN